MARPGYRASGTYVILEAMSTTRQSRYRPAAAASSRSFRGVIHAFLLPLLFHQCRKSWIVAQGIESWIVREPLHPFVIAQSLLQQGECSVPVADGRAHLGAVVRRNVASFGPFI